MLTIVYTVDCPHCSDEASGTAEMRTLAVDQPEPDGTVVIDVEIHIGQAEFTCTKCGCSVYTGDIDVQPDVEDCPSEDDDEEDEDAGADENQAVAL